MSTVDEIVAAASKLTTTQLLTLRRKLDRLEKKAWESELTVVSAEMKRRRITDEDMDRNIMRRRRESRTCWLKRVR